MELESGLSTDPPKERPVYTSAGPCVVRYCVLCNVRHCVLLGTAYCDLTGNMYCELTGAVDCELTVTVYRELIGRGVVCESDRFRETSIKVESGVLESDMRSLKMTPWSLKMT